MFHGNATFRMKNAKIPMNWPLVRPNTTVPMTVHFSLTMIYISCECRAYVCVWERSLNVIALSIACVGWKMNWKCYESEMTFRVNISCGKTAIILCRCVDWIWDYMASSNTHAHKSSGTLLSDICVRVCFFHILRLNLKLSFFRRDVKLSLCTYIVVACIESIPSFVTSVSEC